MEKKEISIKTYFLVFILIAAGNLLATVYTAVRYSTGVQTKAVVTEVQHKKVRKKHVRSGSTSSNITKISFRYYVNDKEYNKTVKLSGKKHVKEGDEIRVAYNPRKPEKVYLVKQIISGIEATIFWIVITVIQIIIYKKLSSNKSKPVDDEKESQL